MIFYSWRELLPIVLAAMALDLLIGDPRRLPHPVVIIGKWTALLERLLRNPQAPPGRLKASGCALVPAVTIPAFALTAALCWLAGLISPWLGYAAQAWLISTTIAVKGLKDAALDVFGRLACGDLTEARRRVGFIVGRDTAHLDEGEVSRAAVETVAENTVDAIAAPLFFALLGAAPLAMLYRAANTLDSMVGYKNEKYRDFGWASARFDDLLNWIPARIGGMLLVWSALVTKGASAGAAWRAVRAFARLHPSPNAGIPEAAAAGALGIRLGGLNYYGGVPSERARLGWPNRAIEAEDIRRAVRLMMRAAYGLAGGLAIAWLCVLLVTD